MLYALVNSNTNIVENVIVADVYWQPPQGFSAVLLNTDEPCLIGQAYDANGQTRFIGVPPVTPKVYTAYQFLLRFTSDERAAFRTAAETDQNVADFQQLAGAAQEIYTDDPMTIAGMDYLVSVGLLTQKRKSEILS